MSTPTFDRQKFKILIEESSLSMRELSLRAHVSESYFKDLASGKVISPTIDKFIRVCNVLKIAPYILAPELQYPSINNIDEKSLEKALLEILETSKSVEDLTVKQKAQLIINRYQQILGNK